MEPDLDFLRDLAFAKMPFGKYADRYLTDLPEAYLVWFRQQGWPAGRLGLMLASMLEIKTNGQEGLVRRIRNLD